MDSSELKAQGDPSKVAPHSPEFSLQAAPRVLTVKTGAAPLTCDSQGSSHRDAGLDAPQQSQPARGRAFSSSARHLPRLAASRPHSGAGGAPRSTREGHGPPRRRTPSRVTRKQSSVLCVFRPSMGSCVCARHCSRGSKAQAAPLGVSRGAQGQRGTRPGSRRTAQLWHVQLSRRKRSRASREKNIKTSH